MLAGPEEGILHRLMTTKHMRAFHSEATKAVDRFVRSYENKQQGSGLSVLEVLEIDEIE